MFITWLAQIYLSEGLMVPATIEVGSADKSFDFYHPNNAFDYPSLAYDWSALETASKTSPGSSPGVCHIPTALGEEYKSCAHAMLEVWPAGNVDPIKGMINSGTGEDGGSIGTYGNIAWYTLSR